MTPAQEQKLKLQVQLALGAASAGAQLFTSRDPALGLVIAKAMNDVTTEYWDKYMTMYRALKGIE